MPNAALAGVLAFANRVIVDFRDPVVAVALLHLDDDVDQKEQQRTDVVAMKMAIFGSWAGLTM